MLTLLFYLCYLPVIENIMFNSDAYYDCPWLSILVQM